VPVARAPERNPRAQAAGYRQRSCAPTGRAAATVAVALWIVTVVGPAQGRAAAPGEPLSSAGHSALCSPDLVHRRLDGWTTTVTQGAKESCDAGTFVVTLKGPKGESQAFSHPRVGSLAELWVEDFDRDGLVEIAVETQQAHGGKAEVAVFAHGPAGWVERRIAPLSGPAAAGYRGGDHFAFVDGALVRRFRTYLPADSDCCPSGPWRSLGLAYGEGRWVPFEPRVHH
jgi:hypothetical protein